MFWSFVGIMTLKKYGFICCNIFQILSSLGFLILYFLFDFHTGDKLNFYYTRMETTALILAYCLLSILVGATSTIAIKQLYNLYSLFYKRHFNICCCKQSQTKEEEDQEKNIILHFFFFLFH